MNPVYKYELSIFLGQCGIDYEKKNRAREGMNLKTRQKKLLTFLYSRGYGFL